VDRRTGVLLGRLPIAAAQLGRQLSSWSGDIRPVTLLGSEDTIRNGPLTPTFFTPKSTCKAWLSLDTHRHRQQRAKRMVILGPELACFKRRSSREHLLSNGNIFTVNGKCTRSGKRTFDVGSLFEI
jgi:hypothetical protein